MARVKNPNFRRSSDAEEREAAPPSAATAEGSAGPSHPGEGSSATAERAAGGMEVVGQRRPHDNAEEETEERRQRRRGPSTVLQMIGGLSYPVSSSSDDSGSEGSDEGTESNGEEESEGSGSDAAQFEVAAAVPAEEDSTSGEEAVAARRYLRGGTPLERARWGKVWSSVELAEQGASAAWWRSAAKLGVGRACGRPLVWRFPQSGAMVGWCQL